MNRYPFLVLAMAIVAVCFACVQSQSPPPPPPVPVATTCNILSKIQVLNQFYSPQNNPYSAPTDANNIQQGYTLRSEITTDISNAFSNAPDPVKSDLCALDGIFIDSNACLNGNVNDCQNVTGATPVSWGYRSNHNNDNDLAKMYIAISGALWPAGDSTHATDFPTYESNILKILISNTGNGYWQNDQDNLPTISAVMPNDPTTTTHNFAWETVLVALAHELGHVKFAYTVHPNNSHGGNYDFGALEPCGSYIPDFFTGWNYNKNNYHKLMPKNWWRNFGDDQSDDGGSVTEHSLSPYLSDFANPDPNPPANQNPNQLLYTLYSGANEPWASFWGATAPDEDFVETYALCALTAKVTQITLSISGFSAYDIIGGIAGKSNLASKIKCVAGLPVI